MPHAALASVVRSGIVESVHAGTAVALAGDGPVLARIGDPSAVTLPRSALKPLQAVAMLRAGLPLDGHLLALAASSHSGESFHLDGVRRLLDEGGVSVEELRNTPDLPLGDTARVAWLRAGLGPSRLAQNCSGKHAAMLWTCRVNGWSSADYTDPGHPLQQAVVRAVADLAGEPVAATAVDGCGAPALGLSLIGVARAFARLAAAEPETPEGRVAVAMRTHPEWLGGSDRDVTRLLTAVPGLIAKDGAEGVLAAALPDGRALAVKIGDGSPRPVLPVAVALLTRLGVSGTTLGELADVPVLGHGERVGEIRVIGV